MILVTGATGTTGREVVKQLVAAGAAARAFVRDPDRAAAVLGNHVEMVQGDLDEPETLRAAFDGVEKLFLLSPADPRQVEQQGEAVDLAQKAGIRHIVKLSALGAGLDSPVSFGRWHAVTEQQIEESALDYTHLRPHYFMQNTLAFAPTIHSEGCFYAPMKDGQISLVDCRDVAAVAVKALTEPGHGGKTYEITGPEALSFADLAQHIGALLGKNVRYVDIPPVESEKSMVASGVPDWLADALNGLYGIFSAGHASMVTHVVDDVVGRPALTYQQFVADHANRFRNP